MFNIIDERKGIQFQQKAKIKVIGVGGGGGNALDYMIEKKIKDVEFISANTDMQALSSSKASSCIQLGKKRTQGLGSGANPQIARESAEEAMDAIREELAGVDMVFITAGLGGGTGTGASPIIAKVAKESGALTVAVVSKPFDYEGTRRMKTALDGIDQLYEHVDSLICIPNEKLIKVLGGNCRLAEAFGKANEILYGAVQGISDLITRQGLINLDFADVKTVMSNTGMAMIGAGSATGENRAKEAAMAAINHPLLEDIDVKDAKGLLVNITASEEISLKEHQEVNECAQSIANENAEYIAGVVIAPEVGDTLRVAIVATGLENMHLSNRRKAKNVAYKPGQLINGQHTVVVEKNAIATGVKPMPSDVVKDTYTPPLFSAAKNLNMSRSHAVRNDDEQGNDGEDYYDVPSILRVSTNGFFGTR